MDGNGRRAIEGCVEDLGVEGVEVGEDMLDADDEEKEDVGERKPIVGRRPQEPTKAEIEEHFPNHAHYRSWCADCRSGRSISRHHKKRQEDDKPLGRTIRLDYTF